VLSRRTAVNKLRDIDYEKICVRTMVMLELCLFPHKLKVESIIFGKLLMMAWAYYFWLYDEQSGY
jgi:hypothetical protein